MAMPTAGRQESSALSGVESAGHANVWIWAALAVALVALAGSLMLSMVLKLKACPLCLYQRTFVMGVVAVLGVGLVARARPALLGLLSLPLAMGSLGVAGFHEYLEQTGKLECPAGVLGVGTAPQQSLAVSAVLLVLLTVGALRDRREAYKLPGVVGAILLGILLSGASVASAPPMPPAPTKPYEQPMDICRPPFRAS